MKKIVYIALFLLSLGVLLFLLFYTPQGKVQRVQRIDSKVSSTQGEVFVSSKDLEREILAVGMDLVGKNMDSVNTLELERRIKINNLFRKVNVYKTPRGILKVEVEQVEPLFVVLPASEQDSSYYVTYSRGIVPFAGPQKYALPLIPVTGPFNQERASGPIFDLVQLIQKDAYWSSFFIQLFFDRELGMIAVPRIGNTMIIFGHEPLWQEKLNKLHLFIQKVVPKFGWNNFVSVNLDYKDQIIVIPQGQLRERFPLPETYELEE